jgi:hypothetical protein
MPEATYPHIYRVTMVGDFAGQQCLNMFFYGGATAFTQTTDIVAPFESTVFAALRPILSSSYTLDRLDVQHMRGGGDFGTVAVGTVGSVTGDALPPFVSWDFTILRGAFHERNGYKRFAGVAESQQLNGVATTAALSLLGTAALALASTLTVDTVIYDPVIQRRVVNGVPLLDPSYWTTGGAAYSKLGTQNSRKPGHGF